MTADRPPGVGAMAPADLAAADRACDAFEAEWRAGRSPRLEAFCPGGADPNLVAELLCVEVAYRRRRGEEPRAADYAARFPTLDPGWLAELLPGPPPTPVAVADPTTPAGPRLGRFQLFERVGEGATGAVWRAFDPALERVVALKVPHPGLLHAAGARERFLREARTAAALRHPHIVAVHEVADADGAPVLVEDFVAGESLRDLLARRRLAPREAADLAADLADALDAAHRAGAVHRDVKPANVVVADRGGRLFPVLVDFGLALRDEAVPTLTADGQVVGTPAYMAPEQARGDGHAADARTDVYGLGAVLYEMLTGEPPFRGTRAMLLRQVVEDDPAPPRRIDHRVPRDLETVCLRAVAKEPHRRYAAAGEFAADLRRFLAGEPVKARRAGPAERAAVWVRRHPAAAALAAVSGLAVVAGVIAGVALLVNTRLEAAYRNEVQARELASAEHRRAEQVLYFHRVSLAAQEWAADHPGRVRRLLEECPPALRGWEWRYLRALPRGQLFALAHDDHPGREYSVTGVAHSPDGRRLASLDYAGGLKVWDAETGSAVHTAPTGDPVGAMGLAWSPDGRHLAVCTREGAVELWDADAGRRADPAEFARPGKSVAYSVAFSADGRFLAAGYGDPWWGSPTATPGVVRVWEVAARKLVREVTGLRAAAVGLAWSPDGSRLAVAEGIWRATFAPAGGAGGVSVWDAATGRRVLDPAGFSGPALGVAWSPDGTRLAGVGWSPDGTRVATGGAEGVVRLWDTATWREVGRLRGHTQSVMGLSWRPDGRRLASAGADSVVRVWEPTVTAEAQVFRRPGPIAALDWAPDGAAVVVAANPAGRPGEVAILSADGSVTATLPGVTGRVNNAVVAPNGRYAAAVADDLSVSVWDLRAAGGPVRLPDSWVKPHDRSAVGLAFGPGGRLYTTAADTRPSADGTFPDPLVCHDVPSGRPAGPPLVGALAALPTRLVLSPDGSLLVGCPRGFPIGVWETATGRLVRRFAPHARVTAAAAFSPDGRFLATGSWDTTVKLWAVADLIRAGEPAPVHTLRGHDRFVLAVAFGPDGTRLATAGEDGAIKLWDTATGLEALTLTGHADAVTALAFRPDGSALASGSADGTVRVWGAP